MEVVIRDRGAGAYFAYAATPRRAIAPVAALDRAVKAIEFVHAGKPAAAPSIPDAFVQAALSGHQTGAP